MHQGRGFDSGARAPAWSFRLQLQPQRSVSLSYSASKWQISSGHTSGIQIGGGRAGSREPSNSAIARKRAPPAAKAPFPNRWSERKCLGSLAVDDLRFVGLGRDRDGTGLHRLRQLTYEVDVQQSIFEICALHQDVVGKLEPALEAAAGDAAMQKSGLLHLGLLLAANREGVL